MRGATMRASGRLGWRVAAVAAFAATAALAVTLSRGAPMRAALTSAKHPTGTTARAGAARTRAAGTPRCATSRLHISVGTAASTGARTLRVTQYRLEFTNESGAACVLSGYPQVAAYRGDGAPVGNAAGRAAGTAARRVLLAPGATAHAVLVASIAPASCAPVLAAGLRVVPPGQSAARYVGHALTACSAEGTRSLVYLRVRAVEPGTGAAAHRPRERRATATPAS